MAPLAQDPLAAAIVLAATAAGDTDAACAALDPALRGRVEAIARALSGLRQRGREAAVAELVAATSPRVPEGAAQAPARARAVVALLARERGSAWLREAGTPRVGFRATAALRTTIACTEDDAWRG